MSRLLHLADPSRRPYRHGPRQARPRPHHAHASTRHPDLRDARHYATLGWPVHRIHPSSKKPATRHGLNDATSDPAELARMFEQPGNLATPGRINDLILDFDAPTSPHLTHAQRANIVDQRITGLAQHYPELARAPTVRTPSGGAHLYLTIDPTRHTDLRCAPFGPKRAPLGDIRGLARAYALLPPSRTPSGAYHLHAHAFPRQGTAPQISDDLYRWLTSTANTAAHADSQPQPANRNPTASTTVHNPRAYARAILERATAKLAATPIGQRHHATLKAANSLGHRLAEHKDDPLPGLTYDAAYAALQAGAQANGYWNDDPQKAARTIEDGLRYGQAHHLHPPRPSRRRLAPPAIGSRGEAAPRD